MYLLKYYDNDSHEHVTDTFSDEDDIKEALINLIKDPENKNLEVYRCVRIEFEHKVEFNHQ